MRIGLIGDYSEEITAHRAIPLALKLEAEELGIQIDPVWLDTASLTRPEMLEELDAGWVVPASPYASFENALSAIRFLRESDKPFLGTCGGYQHALVEYARNVLRFKEAGISEIDPECPMPLVSSLVCALIEVTDPVLPEPNGLVDRLCNSEGLQETYRCSFGINPDYEHIFEGSEFHVAARDPNGAVRAMALANHTFFLGTAFQPERSALEGKRHPIVSGFVAAIK